MPVWSSTTLAALFLSHTQYVLPLPLTFRVVLQALNPFTLGFQGPEINQRTLRVNSTVRGDQYFST